MACTASTRQPPAVATALSRALSDRKDVLVAILFGSQATGRAKPDSDVDVAVLAPGVDLLDLTEALSAAVGRDADVVTLDEVTVPLLAEIVAHGVVLHEGRPGAAARWWSSALADLETDLPWYRRMSRAWLAHVAAGGLAGGRR